MKKVIVITFVLLLCLVGVAFAGGNKEAAGSQGTGKPLRAVWCSAMNNESQPFAYKMFKKYMAQYNIEISVLDDQGDAAKQAANVAQAVAANYQWIIVNPTDAAGIVTAFKAAKEARPNIIISTYSSDVPDDAERYRDFFVGMDDATAGAVAANAFIEKFPNGGNIVEIGGQAGHNAQILRHDGFISVMKDHPEFKILDIQNTEHWATDEAQSIMEDFITKYGKKIDAVFVHWDNGATGVISAVQAAGLNGIVIVGVDGCKAGFDQVREGTQYATIMNNFETQSIASLELVSKLLAGEKVASNNYAEMDIVTLANINEFTTPEW
ncbi:sugar ABC transporter substrate-binding protein [Parasphaerochaeta coccoides]|uniref:Bifunctional carbohydrate binding and transport protein n=1 Tax=Parasphaerochaeta coccoides (strain ATCC BAA-1237 / DSM 17374 / SPN1) TaxID=760011 RepID=F4GJ44_PARC1|nr:sugar ABC transporter substrate-binding protein [Parasphaerochaeta coccoides]AEC01339.1 bifunctional carbohydrate binding and transport protein [Parasphaerochaeta coccoides DSM 17374]